MFAPGANQPAPVAALFVRRRSVYKDLCIEAYDADRDARTYAGPFPVVCHPPCRAFGRLRHMALPRPGEKKLAYLALDLARRYGGVVEHPRSSTLWLDGDLSGGILLDVNQCDWGHRARKATRLFIANPPALLPMLPPRGTATLPVELMGSADREATPPAFARFLIALAQSCARWPSRPPDVTAAEPQAGN